MRRAKCPMKYSAMATPQNAPWSMEQWNDGAMAFPSPHRGPHQGLPGGAPGAPRQDLSCPHICVVPRLEADDVRSVARHAHAAPQARTAL